MASKANPLWLSVLLAVLVGLPLGGIATVLCDRALGAAFPLSAACSLAVLWMALRQTRSTLPQDPRRALEVALGVAGAAPFIAFGVWLAHGEPRWVDASGGSICGPIVPPGPTFALILLVCGVMLAAQCASFLRVAVRPLLGVLVVAVTALSVLGLVRGARFPTTENPLETLPVVGTFRVAEGASHPVAGAFLSFPCAAVEPGTTERDCTVWLRPTSAPSADASIATRLHKVVEGSTVQVLRDRRHDLWIVRKPVLHHAPEYVAAFRGPTLTRVSLSLSDFPGEFAPPPGWSVFGLLGVVLALWLAVRVPLVALLPPGRLVDAALRGDGTMRLADGSVLPAPPHLTTYVGTLVLAHSPPDAAPYRECPSPSVLGAGTLAQWADALRAAGDVRCALALSTLVLLGTPLAMAAVLRLLW